MTIFAHIRERRLRGALGRLQRSYENVTTPAEMLQRQLSLFNQEWHRISTLVPFYRERRLRDKLPDSFSSWKEFLHLVPPTSRTMVQEHVGSMTSTGRPPEFSRMTGGSTARPIQIPAWESEQEHISRDLWFARSWYGIRPSARLFLLWGHSHLLGTGWRGRLNSYQRELSDRLLGYCRFSAYDLRPENLRRAGDRLLAFRPDFVIGYSVALDLLAQANADRAAVLRKAGVRLVLGAAEAFPGPESAERLARLFDCPVGMEYGSVETGLMAHTHPEGGYCTFWRSYFLEAERVSGTNRHLLRVTSLFPRCFPLVRYEIGDEIELPAGAPDRVYGLRTFVRVIGRCNDSVILADDTAIHSEVFTHAVRPCPEVKGYQVIARDREWVRIEFLADVPLPAEVRQAIAERLGKAHSGLAGIELRRVEALRQTVAGKIRMVVKVEEKR
jgi:phenylacetate-coenzyme A ligase PaaK-like adenylate-forming protein